MNLKNKIRIYPLAIVGALIMLTSCSKKTEDTPPPSPVTVTDIDGNVYHTVTIGSQVWTVENLKTTKFKDGSSIPLVTDSTWGNLTTPGYCWYNNDAAAHKSTYGALYNWYAVNSGKLAPQGWHVPSDAEWATLLNYLGGEDVAGIKLKETGTAHWVSPNSAATNVTGFTALPGGGRYGGSEFSEISKSGIMWSSTEYNSGFAWGIGLSYDYDGVDKSYDLKFTGSSVRCIKN